MIAEIDLAIFSMNETKPAQVVGRAAEAMSGEARNDTIVARYFGLYKMHLVRAIEMSINFNLFY